jgi:hypothetical protein
MRPAFAFSVPPHPQHPRNILCCRASLLHQAEEQEGGLDPQLVDAQLATLVMPHPDVTQCCSALLGQARACMELMQIAGLDLQLCARLQSAGNSGSGGPAGAIPAGGRGGRGGRGRGGRAGRGDQEGLLSPQMAQARAGVAAREGGECFRQGMVLVDEALRLAGERSALRTQVSAAAAALGCCEL